jgi:putative transposase
MPRRTRVHIAGLPLHIVQRGHNRDACFFGDDDRQGYLHWLGEGLSATGCLLHAYVLMTNHVHLLVTAPEAGAVARLMISLGRHYVQYINRSYRRTGTLWDSRYKSSLVDADAYLLCCQRYIELNPVRAGMVNAPDAYAWSSYRCNGEGRADRLVTPHAVYLALGADASSRLEAYRALFRSHFDSEALAAIRLGVQQSQPVGSPRFLDTIERMTGQRREPKPRGRPRKPRAGEVEVATSHERLTFD